VDLEGIATYRDTTLDIVLRAVGIMHQMRLAICRFMVPVHVAEHERVEHVRVARRVVVRIFGFARITENHDISAFRECIARELLVRERNRRAIRKLEP
jgi:hypothetical protein